ncbi:hypothetical protein [Winogradskyella forsetii]|uniref:hypothetical protein n=1 Tax=Winogradskyella forsetii TaxID=2686077 RepID=UPI0015BE5561|nr:hypothetical protein [Winogradskyella forsetii]
MKKFIYLCYFAILVLNYSCGTDEVVFEQENVIITEEKKLDQIESAGKTHATNEELIVQSESIGTSDGDEVYILYLNMDLLEEEYNDNTSNPSYIGSFNIFFRNLMSNHFTIYSIVVSTNSECGNIERWYVSLDELNTYLLSTGENTVSNGEDNELIGGNTSGGNTSSSNSVTGVKDKNKPKGSTNDDEPTGIIFLDYSYCFN